MSSWKWWPFCHHMIAPVTVQWPWSIWVNVLHESNRNWWYNENKTKHNKIASIFYGIYSIYVQDYLHFLKLPKKWSMPIWIFHGISTHLQLISSMKWVPGKFTKWLPPWRKGRITCLWIESVFDCLTIDIIHETMVVHMTWVWIFFNNYSNHPRMCVLSTLCGNVDKHSPFDIYIYTYIHTYTHIYIYTYTPETPSTKPFYLPLSLLT